MQKMYPRTNIAPFEVTGDSNVKPAPQIEEALRESVRQNAAIFATNRKTQAKSSRT